MVESLYRPWLLGFFFSPFLPPLWISVILGFIRQNQLCLERERYGLTPIEAEHVKERMIEPLPLLKKHNCISQQRSHVHADVNISKDSSQSKQPYVEVISHYMNANYAHAELIWHGLTITTAIILGLSKIPDADSFAGSILFCDWACCGLEGSAVWDSRPPIERLSTCDSCTSGVASVSISSVSELILSCEASLGSTPLECEACKWLVGLVGNCGWFCADCLSNASWWSSWALMIAWMSLPPYAGASSIPVIGWSWLPCACKIIITSSQANVKIGITDTAYTSVVQN